MPTTSKKQERFMQAVANNPKFAKKVGVPMSVGKEFTKAEGGVMKNPKLAAMFKGKETKGEELKEARAIKSGKITPEQYALGEKMEEGKMKKAKMYGGGASRAPKKDDMGAMGMKKGGMPKYAKGGGIESRGKTKGKMC